MTGAKTEYLKGDESDQTEIARYRIILIIYEKIPNQTKMAGKVTMVTRLHGMKRVE